MQEFLYRKHRAKHSHFQNKSLEMWKLYLYNKKLPQTYRLEEINKHLFIDHNTASEIHRNYVSLREKCRVYNEHITKLYVYFKKKSAYHSEVANILEKAQNQLSLSEIQMLRDHEPNIYAYLEQPEDSKLINTRI